MHQEKRETGSIDYQRLRPREPGPVRKEDRRSALCCPSPFPFPSKTWLPQIPQPEETPFGAEKPSLAEIEVPLKSQRGATHLRCAYH